MSERHRIQLAGVPKPKRNLSIIIRNGSLKVVNNSKKIIYEPYW